ncbi:MAG: hypothetical protein AVDCRST_MAG87-1659 [uncultured Thermomicrobiales bacterium]|uniref:Uncharacterized protein n=1 Tax=uncultured Thermomicrobiales bacterium TaxID=1645740 RepID=A0A6J4UVZ2_9BACT|nr:MAG: hypothetical protein AVDCRST_MAG87-1659 [uncultured Thermomicrobiales bacterium]
MNDERRHPKATPADASDTGAAYLQNIFSAISWALLVGVMFGGYSLLRMLSSGDGLTDHEEQFFRAGHAHAGVLNVIGILYGTYLGRTMLTARHQIAAWLTYILGVALMSGGFFVHMAVGEPGDGSIGTTLTALGGAVLAITVLFLAWHLFRARSAGPVALGPEANRRESRA